MDNWASNSSYTKLQQLQVGINKITTLTSGISQPRCFFYLFYLNLQELQLTLTGIGASADTKCEEIPVSTAAKNRYGIYPIFKCFFRFKSAVILSIWPESSCINSDTQSYHHIGWQSGLSLWCHQWHSFLFIAHGPDNEWMWHTSLSPRAASQLEARNGIEHE